MKRIHYYDPNAVGLLDSGSGGRIYNFNLVKSFVKHMSYSLNVIGGRKRRIPFTNISFFLRYCKCIATQLDSSASLFVLDISNSFGSLIYLIFSKLFGCDVVLIAHHFTMEELLSKMPKYIIKRFYFRISFFLSDVVVVPSIYTKTQVDLIHSATAVKVKVINPPIKSLGIRREGFGNRPEVRSLIFVGRMDDKRKNLREMVEVFSHLSSATIFKLVGSCDFNSEYIKDVCSLIDGRGLSDRIFFLGKLSEMDLRRELTSSDLFLMLSEVEGYGMAAAEAIKVGVPVVAFNKGGLREVVEDAVTGLLLESMDAVSLSKPVQLLLDNSDKLGEMSEECLKRGVLFQTEETFSNALKGLELSLRS